VVVLNIYNVNLHYSIPKIIAFYVMLVLNILIRFFISDACLDNQFALVSSLSCVL
jgi:hypothetical protein